MWWADLEGNAHIVSPYPFANLTYTHTHKYTHIYVYYEHKYMEFIFMQYNRHCKIPVCANWSL